ncbi:MAG: helix-turn-helix transcriptional regulator [Pirellulales bacterium]|nr:helix-turn-helix transcriptional regulator [Pirellulales bacterium]
MVKRHAKRLRRELTPEERQRWKRAKEETEKRKEEILVKGRRLKAAHDRANVAVREALKLLKAERQAQGLSLSDVEKKTGIGRAALSRLENEAELNPTVVTLTRYAEALGKKIVVSFD